MLNQSVRLSFLPVGVLVTCIATSVVAVIAQPAERRSVISLTVAAEGLAAAYASDLDRRVGVWFYPEEPLELLLSLSNGTREPLRLSAPWHSAVRVVTRRVPQGGLLSRTNPSVQFQWREVGGRVAGSPQGRGLQIAPGRSEEIRLRLVGQAAPGIYDVRVALDDVIAPPELRRRVDVEFPPRLFGVRGLESNVDRMNQAAHMAVRAAARGDGASSERWARELLALNPSSLPGFSLLGNALRLKGNCDQASAQWTRALEIALTNGDPELAREGFPSHSPVEDLRARIADCR